MNSILREVAARLDDGRGCGKLRACAALPVPRAGGWRSRGADVSFVATYVADTALARRWRPGGAGTVRLVWVARSASLFGLFADTLQRLVPHLNSSSATGAVVLSVHLCYTKESESDAAAVEALPIPPSLGRPKLSSVLSAQLGPGSRLVMACGYVLASAALVWRLAKDTHPRTRAACN